MTLGTDDRQTSGFFDFRRQFDIRTTTCHVGSDGHYARTACFSHHLRLLLVQLRVKDVMFDFTDIEHFAQELGYLDGSSTYQYRSTLLYHSYDLINDRIVFLAFGAIDTVVHIDTCNGFIGRDDHYIEFVDIPELACFGLGRTGHTGELVVHTEIVLQRDSSERLRSSLHFDVLLGFHSLMQTIGPTTTFHDTTGLLINDLHFTVIDDIIDIFLEEGVGFEQLVNGMHTFGFNTIVGEDIVLTLLTFICREGGLVLQFRHFGAYVRQDEEIRVFRRTGEGINTFIGEFDRLVLLIDHEIEFVGRDMHVFLVLLEVELFGLLHTHSDPRFREVFDEGFGLRHTFERSEERQFPGFFLFLVRRPHFGLGFREQFGS